MEFKKPSIREWILIAAGVFVLCMVYVMRPHAAHHDIADDPLPVKTELQETPAVIEEKSDGVSDHDDETAGKELKAQMEADRNQQRQIKMLKMQLEQANLQLENEKTVEQISKLKKEDAGYVKDSALQGAGFPSMKIIYIGGTAMNKEAILSIGGTSFSVKEHDKPLEHVEIMGISNNSVKVHFNAPQELTTVIHYVQE